jgi:ribonuclease P protein subunit RPR2
MAQRSRSKPDYQVKIAKERIDILFDEASKTREKDLQNRYVEIARKIGMRYNVKLPGKYQRKFCRYCFAYFGTDVKRRVKDGRLVITCLDCKKINRFLYK